MIDLQNDRLFLGELLSPPSGYQLDQAIGTSYSLDLSALLSVPMALYFSEHPEVNLEKGIIPLLEAIQRTSRKLTLFCQKGQIKLPEKHHKLYSWLEAVVEEINLGTQGSFHPKLWILRFRGTGENIIYRIIVTSRNLTYDQSGDLVFSLEGLVSKANRRANKEKNKPLVRFIEYLLKDKSKEQYATFLNDLANVAFEPGDPVEDFEFWPIGIPGYERSFTAQLGGETGVVISPFLSSYAIDKLWEVCPDLTLISREEEFRKFDQQTLDGITCYHHKATFLEGSSLTEEEDLTASDTPSVPNQDIHAKLYCFKQGWDSHLFLGSANCTTRAFEGKNIEFMIGIHGKNSKMGPHRILNELRIGDEKGFFTLFEPEDPSAPDLYEAIDKQLEHLQKQLTQGEFKGKVEIGQEGLFSIHLSFDTGGHEIKAEGFDIQAKLLFHGNQPIPLSFEHLQEFTIKNIRETEISQWLLITISHKERGREKQFATKIALENLPAGRDEKIIGELIHSPGLFFQYIRFLLADNYWDAVRELEDALSGEKHDFKRWGNGGNGDDYPILESMMHSLAHNRETLDNLEYFINTLRKHDHFKEVIPTDFLSLWNTFQKVNTQTIKDPS